jgi:DNA anti-recombination protein RmuC
MCNDLTNDVTFANSRTHPYRESPSKGQYMSASAVQRVFQPMSNSAENEEFVTYSEFRGFVTETRTGFVHIESKIDWLQSTMNIRFEAMNERFNSVDKRFDDFTTNIDKRFDDHTANMNKRFEEFTANIDKRFEEFTANIDKRFNEFSASINTRFDDLNKRFDDANTKSHREFVGIMLGFLSINLVIIGSVVGLIAKTG